VDEKKTRNRINFHITVLQLQGFVVQSQSYFFFFFSTISSLFCHLSIGWRQSYLPVTVLLLAVVIARSLHIFLF
jgi:hypothetical protein